MKRKSGRAQHVVAIAAVIASVAAPDARGQTSAHDAGPLSAFARTKAETLVRDALPCLGCHSLGVDGGRLAPDLATVRDRRDASYIARMISDPQGTVRGTLMPRTPMPDAWRSLVIRYLGGDPGASRPLSPSPAAMTAADTNGASLYARFCVGCHGAAGGGDGPNATALPVRPARHASRADMTARSDDALYDTIAGGGAIMGRSQRMPAYGETLTSSQIRALVRHIRALCRCAGPAWSTDGGAPHG